MAHLLFTCLKNDGAFLLEWLAYHRRIGFDHALVFSNDCTDDSPALLDALAASGVITHLRNDSYDARGPQWAALRSKPLRKALRGADYAAHLDLDEFLHIKCGTGHLRDLIAAGGGADAFSLPWRFFGNAGIDHYEDAPITGQFTRTGPYPLLFPRQAMMFKTLFRAAAPFRPGIHAPRATAPVDWRQGDGRPVSPGFARKPILLAGSDAGNGCAEICHYALRSRESFLVKATRGLPNRRQVPIDSGYWVLRNFNDTPHDGLARWQDEIARETAALRALPGVARAHDACVAWHRAEIERQFSTENGLALYGAICAAGDTKRVDPGCARQIYARYQRLFAA